jgi:hypothetical protein
LLEALRIEGKRDRRKLLLSLLESHGEAARIAVLNILRNAYSHDFGMEESYFRRNLLYLIRRIPAAQNEDPSELIRLLARHADPDFPLIVVKEAITCLGQVKHAEAEEALSLLLAETESQLNSSKSTDESNRWISLLDRITASLARQGTSHARKVLLDHALSKKQKWGNTIGRLSDLAVQDLASDPMAVRRLLTALHSALPKKVLGLVIQKRDQDLQSIANALSSTTTPEVRQALQELGRNIPESVAPQPPPSRSAGFHEPPVSISESKEPAPSVSSLTGDLDLFGLPGLFQSIGDHAWTGTLTLKDFSGSSFATVDFSKGKFVSCEFQHLSGESAIYQLLERPNSGTFYFSRNTVAEEKASREVLPLLMEGIRRYDELQQLQIILPDDTRIRSTGAQPAVLREERDGLLFRDLWNAVRDGSTPKQCEARIAVDSYRIRRLLVHWLETGSITNTE